MQNSMRWLSALFGAAVLASCSAPGHWSSTGAPALDAKFKSADAGKLDDKGYIRQWLILGPIAFGDTYSADDIDKDQIKDEANLMPRAGDKQTVATADTTSGASRMVSTELTWQAVTTPDFFFDLNQILKLDSSDGMGAYAVAYLDAPEEMKGIKFSLCSNDNGKVFLNGKSVYLYVGGRALAQDADVVPDLTLRKGINVVIFKVWNDANDWQGCLRLLTRDDKPVNNVTVRLPK